MIGSLSIIRKLVSLFKIVGHFVFFFIFVVFIMYIGIIYIY
jgi:hypothetical protein